MFVGKEKEERYEGSGRRAARGFLLRVPHDRSGCVAWWMGAFFFRLHVSHAHARCLPPGLWIHPDCREGAGVVDGEDAGAVDGEDAGVEDGEDAGAEGGAPVMAAVPTAASTAAAPTAVASAWASALAAGAAGAAAGVATAAGEHNVYFHQPQPMVDTRFLSS